jgi:hypothetical protein
MENKSQKMELNKKKELRLFLFTVQSGPTFVNVQQDVKAVFSNDELDAFTIAKKDYPEGQLLSITRYGSIDVEQIRTIIDNPMHGIENPMHTTTKDRELSVPVKEGSQSEFIYGLSLLADRYVESPRDKAALKRIVSKIKIDDIQEG